MSDLTYIFDNDMVYAVREGKVIASGSDITDLQHLAMGEPPAGITPDQQPQQPYGGNNSLMHAEQQNAVATDPQVAQLAEQHGVSPEEAFFMMQGQQDQQQAVPDGQPNPMDVQPVPGQNGQPDMMPPADPQAVMSSTDVVGPGGLKGKVLGKVRDVWGEQVTVRFENGRIAHLRVTDAGIEGGHSYSMEKTASAPEASVLDKLSDRLNAHYDPSAQGITDRLAALREIRQEAAAAIGRTASVDDHLLDQLVVTADVEATELRSALDHIESELNDNPAPFEMQAAPAQASMGHDSSSTWLSHVAEEMHREAASTDFAKLVNEGAAVFVSDLSNAAVADMGVTAGLASDFIQSKTAGIADDSERVRIARAFTDKAEEARKSELSSRRQTTHKEAATVPTDKFAEYPDDILFG